MKLKKSKLLVLLFLATIFVSSNVFAASFWKTGTITRTMTDTSFYGGCMIHLSTSISNGCPSSGWVSLDCNATKTPLGTGQRAYASALVALSLGKKVSVKVDNGIKVNNHCVATRVDIRN